MGRVITAVLKRVHGRVAKINIACCFADGGFLRRDLRSTFLVTLFRCFIAEGLVGLDAGFTGKRLFVNQRIFLPVVRIVFRGARVGEVFRVREFIFVQKFLTGYDAQLIRRHNLREVIGQGRVVAVVRVLFSHLQLAFRSQRVL